MTTFFLRFRRPDIPDACTGEVTIAAGGGGRPGERRPLGCGAESTCPYAAYEALAKMSNDGKICARTKQDYRDDKLFFAYRKAAATAD